MSLAEQGKSQIPWFRERMPLIAEINRNVEEKQTFKGQTIAICMHIEPKTAIWIEGMIKGKAEHIWLIGCLGTTKPEIAAYMNSFKNVTVYGKKHDTYEDHLKYLDEVLQNPVNLFLDNGASLIIAHHNAKTNWQPLGANEETRTGKLLLEKNGINTPYPLIVIDDSPSKQILENAIGVGQSVVDGFMRSTSLLVGGKKVLVIGYGFCGSGVAQKFKSLGAITMVYDILALNRLKAKVEGFEVGNLIDLLPRADVVITVTGSFNVITSDHIKFFKKNCILANSGHFGFEIDVENIKKLSLNFEKIKEGIEKISFKDKNIFLIQNANPINLASADGNPVEIMDLGLGLQAESAQRIIENSESLEKGIQPVPGDIEEFICSKMLDILA